MLDRVVRGGEVVDGTGTPARRADVGIRDGRIVAVGAIDEPAREKVDADGLVVAPGFVDVHTHYDAQVLWDGTCSPSPFHGVTTVIGGNCGFSIAPIDETSAPFVRSLLAKVEGIPESSLKSALDWSWRGFGDYLTRMEGALAVNAGFFVGHSAVRRLVLGEECHRPATKEQVAAMADVVAASLVAGAVGFSSSWGEPHVGAPSLGADAAEICALAEVVGAHPGTMLGFIPTLEPFDEAAAKLMAAMSLAADRPVSWNLIVVRPGNEAVLDRWLSVSDMAAANGAAVFPLFIPDATALRVNLRTGFLLDTIPGWSSLFELAASARIDELRVPERRRALAEAASGFPRRWTDFGSYVVDQVTSSDLAPLVGRSLRDLAGERGCTAADVLFDVAVDDDLRAIFRSPAWGDDADAWERRRGLLGDKRVIVGGSDAGAHLDMLATFGLTSALLGPTVRDRGLVDLPTAVHLVTDRPARLFGLRERGRIVPGWWADLTLFDPATIGPRPVTTRFDLPAGAPRLVGEAVGIRRVVVNGVDVVVDGELQAVRPGTVLRSGRDTETVTAAAALAGLVPRQ